MSVSVFVFSFPAGHTVKNVFSPRFICSFLLLSTLSNSFLLLPPTSIVTRGPCTERLPVCLPIWLLVCLPASSVTQSKGCVHRIFRPRRLYAKQLFARSWIKQRILYNCLWKGKCFAILSGYFFSRGFSTAATVMVTMWMRSPGKWWQCKYRSDCEVGKYVGLKTRQKYHQFLRV